MSVAGPDFEVVRCTWRAYDRAYWHVDYRLRALRPIFTRANLRQAFRAGAVDAESVAGYVLRLLAAV